MDDSAFDDAVPEAEREAVRSSLAGLGAVPLPADVATRLDARLAAELDSSPLAARRARRRRVRLGASLSAAAAVAAIAVFALGWGGGGHTPPATQSALESGAASTAVSAVRAADSAAPAAATAAKAAATKPCRPASRTGGSRPRAGCPGARGGHARAV